MNPFSSTPKAEYKAENFFPAINDDYCAYLRRRVLLLQDMGVGEKFSQLVREGQEPFNVEKPTFDPTCPQLRPLKTGQVYNFASVVRTKVDHMVRCVKLSEDGLNNKCTFERVDNIGENLKGKDLVLIVCVFMPAKWCDFSADLLCPLSLISAELSPSSHPNFEIIFVPKMRKIPNKNAYYGETEFFHFFSAFPGRLALPCTNPKACDYFCSRFGFDGYLTAVLLSGGRVVDRNAYNIFRFGSAGFPFTRDRFSLLEYQLSQFHLENILGLSSSSLLHNFGSSKAATVEDLGDKVVGLYLFRTGEKFKIYNEVYKQCQDRDLAAGRVPSFEIVLVCNPPVSSIHPYAYQKEVVDVLTQFELCNSWWFLPYDHSTCRRLILLSNDSMADEMIIVGPKSQFVEPCGGEILCSFGADAFPFDREVIIQRYLEKLENVTLSSLLSCGPVHYVLTHDQQQIPISELKGKNVILYVSDSSGFAGLFDQFEMLREWCREMEKHQDFEVIYLLLKDSDDEAVCKHPCRDTKWLEYPSDLEHSNKLRVHEAFFRGSDSRKHKAVEGLDSQEVLLFGKDGYLHMFDARYYMFPRGIKDDPFHSDFRDLRDLLMDRMKDGLEFLNGYY